jgi:hypothetical protein
MKIALLEFCQEPSETAKHFVTKARANRLVDELKVAVRISATKIKLTVAKSWTVVKSWLAISAEQRKQAAERELAYADFVKQMKARAMFPDGAEYGFAPWPAKDQRNPCYSS